jgi:hypothetical protein
MIVQLAFTLTMALALAMSLPSIDPFLVDSDICSLVRESLEFDERSHSDVIDDADPAPSAPREMKDRAESADFSASSARRLLVSALGYEFYGARLARLTPMPVSAPVRGPPVA